MSSCSITSVRRWHIVQPVFLLPILVGASAALPMNADASDSDAQTPHFDVVARILDAYCTGCHSADEPEAGLSLASFADLERGIAHGPVVVPGQPQSSRLLRVLTGQAEPVMPPEDNEAPTEEEIAVLTAWIAGGALGPEGAPKRRPLIVPKLDSTMTHDSAPITAIARSPDGQSVAVGRFGRIDVLAAESRKRLFSIEGLPGKVNSLRFSPSGSRLVAATGVGGLYGQANVYDAAGGKLLLSVEGHRDILTDAELDRDESLLATASYDGEALLWDAASGEMLREFSGHNGPLFDLAFSPDGTVLATASGDETVKVWKVSTGERLDTLGQPEAEQYTVAFSPDGRQIAAGGADRRIRVWEFVSTERPVTNPLRFTRHAHDGAVTAAAFSRAGDVLLTAGNDRRMKAWDTSRFTVVKTWPAQPAMINDLSMSKADRRVAVAGMNGAWQLVELTEAAERNFENSLAETQAATLTDRAPLESGDPVTEAEPNDSPERATPLAVPGSSIGVIHAIDKARATDRDLYRFQAQIGEQFIFEIDAARDGSPLDSKLEVLTAAGERIERVVLQAVRESYVTFRGQSSDQARDFRLHNWEEMDLDEYLYLNGEVVRLWFYPLGPDSGFWTYPGVGKRWTYFGTSAITHAVNEPVYTVTPYPPGSELPASGLPAFPVYFENDDDGRRELGADSRLYFTAPADGEYLVAVSDVRGFGGEAYRYRLDLRRPRPDFHVNVSIDSATINAGSGREFTVDVDRRDGFDEAVRIDIADLPPGFEASTPVVVERDQKNAYGVIYARPGAEPPAEEDATPRITASASVAGQQRVKEVEPFGPLNLGDAPKVRVAISASGHAATWSSDAPLELEIAPGETISAVVHVERNGDFGGEVPLGKEVCGRNLPHGVIVDNIGLNGLLVVAGEESRTFFLTAAKWVPETERMFHLRTDVGDGGQASRPVLLNVRRRPQRK